MLTNNIDDQKGQEGKTRRKEQIARASSSRNEIIK